MNKIFTNEKIDYYISENMSSSFKTNPRKVELYEIELYTTSTNTSVINGEKHEQKHGNILISKPGDIRYSINSFECYYAHFKCDDEQISVALNALPKVFAADNADIVTEIFKNIIRKQKTQNFQTSLYVQGKLLELISLLLIKTSHKYSGRYQEYVPAVKTACDFMKNSLESQISLSDIAKKVNLSAGFFHKVFKSIKGITPLQYLTSLRLNLAKDMLSGTNASLADIAILCGFNSQAYFNYVFSKKLSETPKSYRDKNQIII